MEPETDRDDHRRPVGRPTKYDPIFCEMVEYALRQGFSLTGFAGGIGVARSTINEWMASFPEFSEACSRAKAASAFCWEGRANRVAEVGGGPGTAQVILFALKNVAPDDWSFDKRARVMLPKLDSAKAAMAAISDAIAAFAAGEIDRENLETIVSSSKRYLEAVEVVDIERRLAALEGAPK